MATSETRRGRAGARLPALLLCLVAVAAPPAAGQCAMCRESVARGEDREQVERLSRGFNYSVLAMMSVPAVLASGLVTVIVVNNRAREKRGL